MKKEMARKLLGEAERVAQMYSKPDREFNHNSETFKLMKLKPLSDMTAVGIFRKHPTQKIALAFFFWTNGSGGRWNYFFPTDSHALGMGRVQDLLYQVEQKNFPLNFEVPQQDEVE